MLDWAYRFLISNYRLENFPPGCVQTTRAIRTLEDTLILPSTVGLHDANGKPIIGSWLERGPETHADYPFGQPKSIDTKAYLAEAQELNEGVFLPYCNLNHFGHLLTESAGWLWPFLDKTKNLLKECDQETRLLIADLKEDRRHHENVARLVGMPIDKVQSCLALERPIFCRRLHLPVPSMINRRWIADHHFEAVQRLTDSHYGITESERNELLKISSDPNLSDKIYLSRSQLSPDHRLLIGESRLETELRNRGWKIVYPELLSIKEQLRVLAQSQTIAGESGSAFHLLMYFGHRFANKSVVMLGVRKPSRDPRITNFIAQFRKQSVGFVYFACLGFKLRRLRQSKPTADQTPMMDRQMLATPRWIASRIDEFPRLDTPNRAGDS
jgi:hypothetical protein